MIKLKLKNIVSLVLYALANTALSFSIIFIINNALSGKEDFLKNYTGIVFIALIVYTYLLNIVFQKALNKFTFNFLYDKEKTVFAQILRAPIRKLEKLGSQQFYTVIEDLRIFSALPAVVTHTVNSILMILLCLAYMFSLSVVSALFVVVLVIAVAGCYLIVIKSMSREVLLLRKQNEEYYEFANDLIKGFKELKLSFFRRESLLNKFLVPNRNKSEVLDFGINYVFLSINLISQYGLYFVIGIILFILPEIGLLLRESVIAYVVVVLFISGPINTLINLQQTFTRLMIASKRIKTFMNDFESDENFSEQLSETDEEFRSLSFERVTFSYKDENDPNASFALGPIDLTVKKGEVIFIVGGNGSGKSTFINLLTGLYMFSSGDLFLNGKREDNIRKRLQDMISAVFTDNHIFSRNYDHYQLEKNSTYLDLLRVMRLDELVLDDSEASARKKLSKGQSKRMSLIFALLENKPILVLDEWAADQDPFFRKYFYENLIPRLRQENKTIIAVTHDDAYFHHADRIIKFDNGRIVEYSK